MEGVKYWSEMLRKMALEEIGSGIGKKRKQGGSMMMVGDINGTMEEMEEEEEEPSHVDIILQYCVDFSEKIIQSNGMSLEKRAEEKRMLIYALRMLAQSWFPTAADSLQRSISSVFSQQDQDLLASISLGTDIQRQ